MNGGSVLFYPEGTRGKKPLELLPFKTGAFRVADYVKCKILPITLINTHKACNRGICDIADIKIIIDEPFNVLDIKNTVEKTRHVMLNNIKCNN